MKTEKQSVWFEGKTNINCNIETVNNSLENLGEHFKSVVTLMPGMTSVELIEQGNNSVTIRTNEGIMKRSNISIEKHDDRVTLQFDEEYKAGKTITANSHFFEEFTLSGSSILLRIVISNLKAPGFIGFFYRNFGSKNIGKAFLAAYKAYLEK